MFKESYLNIIGKRNERRNNKTMRKAYLKLGNRIVSPYTSKTAAMKFRERAMKAGHGTAMTKFRGIYFVQVGKKRRRK